jgi:hypothetical protein
MKRSIATFVVTIAMLTAAAPAQTAPSPNWAVPPPSLGGTTFTPVSNATATYGSNFIPPIPCELLPPTSAAWCTAVNSKIASYNSILGYMNQIQNYQQEAQMYLSYPQQVKNYAQQDFQGLMGIVQAIPGLTYATTQPMQAINTTQTTLNQMPDQYTLNASLNTSLNGQIGGALASTKSLLDEDQRDRAQISNIQAAAATAKSNEQLAALNLQLLTILSAQLSRLEQLNATQINAAGSYYFTQNNRNSAAVRAAQQMQQQNSSAVSPVILPH